MFAKSRKYPIQVNQKQVLYPIGKDKDRSDNRLQMEETQDLLNRGHMVYRYLSDEEELQFRAHARTIYEPFAPIEGIWHPVYQEECVRINHELSFYRRPRAPEPEDTFPDGPFPDDDLKE